MKASSAGSRSSRARPPAVLIAAGSGGVVSDVEAILVRRGYTIIRADALGFAAVTAHRAHPDVIVLHAASSDPQGREVSRALRDDPEVGPSVPIVVITRELPTSGQHRDALRAGIWAFLTVPLDKEELGTRLDAFVRTKRDADRLAGGARPARNQAAALSDPLAFAQRARELTLQSFHHSAGLACVVFAPAAEERDRFGAALAAAARKSDAVGRLGSGEFAVVAPGTDPAGAVKLAERFARLASGAPVRAGYEAVGNVRYTPLEPQNLVARARSALRLTERGGAWIRAFEERTR
jgi:PleD family two-component response regulator